MPGITDASALRLVFNANEPASNSITLESLVMSVFNAASGAVLFSSGYADAPHMLRIPLREPALRDSCSVWTQRTPPSCRGCCPCPDPAATYLGSLLLAGLGLAGFVARRRSPKNKS